VVSKIREELEGEMRVLGIEKQLERKPFPMLMSQKPSRELM